jgi:glycosyltransferase involved in cell wall biosynthesis
MILPQLLGFVYNMNPLISVIIPAYNRCHELKRALDSLALQSRRDFETIVCDDGSSEDLKSVVSTFEKHIDVRYIRIENSGGPARPRNTAVAVARGEWVSFLDSDDWWDANRLERVAEVLENENVDFLYHPLRVVNAKTLKGKRERRSVIGEPLRRDPLEHMALFGNPIPNSAAIVRLSALEMIGGISEEMNLLEDFDAWMRLVEQDITPRYIPDVLGSYWIGEDAISRITERHVERQIALFSRHVSLFSPKIHINAESFQHYVLGTMLMQIPGKEFEARNHFYKAQNLQGMLMKIKRLVKIASLFVRR